MHRAWHIHVYNYFAYEYNYYQNLGGLKPPKPPLAYTHGMAHRLELAIKDALCGTFFSTIDELLIRAYYLYAKSPKKCRNLEVVVEELKSCLSSSAFP